jgi:hypothetical protein
MKNIIQNFIKKFDIFFDILILPLCAFSGIIFKIYKKIGVANLSLTTKLLKQIGIFPIRNHYYEPQFIHKNVKFKNQKYIKINFNTHYSIFGKLKFNNELKKLNLHNQKSKFGFFINNSFFEAGDFDFLYQFIRYSRPKKIIEIGSGYSSIIAYEAIIKNFQNSKKFCKMTCIDPGNIDQISNLNKIKFINKKIEEIKINIFKSLNSGDLLIIDSTHMIKPDGDVLKIYNEIIPNLKKGVNIMIHDIFIPYEYPQYWLDKHMLFWNEQYLLQAILNSNKYKILAPLYYLKRNKFNQLKKVCPYLKTDSKPSSFYIKIIK